MLPVRICSKVSRFLTPCVDFAKVFECSQEFWQLRFSVVVHLIKLFL